MLPVFNWSVHNANKHHSLSQDQSCTTRENVLMWSVLKVPHAFTEYTLALSVQSLNWLTDIVTSASLWPHGLQHARLRCPLPTPRACSNSCLSSGWCHPTISSSVVPFVSCLKSFPASGSFPMSLFFASGGQSFGVSTSASALPMNIQD